LRLRGELRADVVEEDVVFPALLVSGVRPPVGEQPTGRRNHRRHEDEQVDGDTDADEWGREPAQRVADYDDATAIADRLDDRVGVLVPAGRLVVAREVDGDRVVPVLLKRRYDEMPIPGTPTTAMDQRERRHAVKYLAAQLDVRRVQARCATHPTSIAERKTSCGSAKPFARSASTTRLTT
jgi:hypothetical protein